MGFLANGTSQAVNHTIRRGEHSTFILLSFASRNYRFARMRRIPILLCYNIVLVKISLG